jgi:hypothetical protein
MQKMKILRLFLLATLLFTFAVPALGLSGSTSVSAVTKEACDKDPTIAGCPQLSGSGGGSAGGGGTSSGGGSAGGGSAAGSGTSSGDTSGKGVDLVGDAQCATAENIQCIESTQDPAVGTPCNNTNCDIFTRYLDPFINAMAIFAGLAVVIGMIYGGIEYAASGGDPQKAASGKRHVKIAIIAFLVFLFLLTMLKFLVPGVLLFEKK